MKENIVISGVSARLPECANINIFRDRLLAGDCFITFDEERWPKETYGLPHGTSKLRDIDKFDSEFFGYSDEEANVLDPMNRILMEETYAAICDAGINPELLRGSNTGFFFGAWIDEVESGLRNDIERDENIFAFHASRVSNAMDFRGPTCYIDNACASSLTALEIGVNSIQSKQCDQALVAGVNINLNPTRNLWQNKLKTLSPDSLCRIWDQNANGYVKGEACVVILIQKKSEAKRIHAEILSIKLNTDGFKEEGFTFPGWKTQKKVMLDALKEAGINSRDLEFFEAHGTGTQVGDSVEIRSISEAICKTRTNPLIIGSIKATIGHTEGASGLSSIVKIIIAYQKQIMAPTLNFEIPNPRIPQLFNGSLIVCDKPLKFKGGIVAINNFGFGGGNGTLIINSFDEKELSEESYQICCPIPRLIFVFGRNNELVEKTLIDIKFNAENLTQEFLSIFGDISNTSPTSGMKSRGFLVLDNEKKCFVKMCDKCFINDELQRPVWYVFPGIGSQWPSMAQSIMKIKIFANSINRSIGYLNSLGAEDGDLKKYLFSENIVANYTSKFEPVLVAIVIIEIALVDLLDELGVKPDGIIGHSMGELVSSYADGCLTAEDTLKISYAIQQVLFSEKKKLTEGLMAAVGLPLFEAQQRCFGSITVACNNSPQLVTMSGSLFDMESLLETLILEKIFVRKLDSYGFALHSSLMKNIESSLIVKLKKLNIIPKQRTSRWVSTSYSDDEWHHKLCQYPNGEYYARNLQNPVLFYESIIKAPKNAIFLEIGPHGILRSSITRSFTTEYNIRYIQMLKNNNNSGNLLILLAALGQLYMSGQTVDIKKIYPVITYPIPRGTEFISPLIKWSHNKSYFVTKFPHYFNPKSNNSLYKEIVTLKDNNQYLSDHRIDGKTLYPCTGYLYLAWKTLALNSGLTDYQKFAVEFSDVTLYRATNLSNDETVFKCFYFKDKSMFAVKANNTLCCDGKIFALRNDLELSDPNENSANDNNDVTILSGEDFYKELKVRGYDYGLSFRGIISISHDGRKSSVKWTGNWITFLDSILQLTIWKEMNRFLLIPTRIESLKINPNLLSIHCSERVPNESSVDVIQDFNTQEIITKGIKFKNITGTPIARKFDSCLVEKYVLLPYEEKHAIDEDLVEMIQTYCNRCENAIHKFEKQNEKFEQISDKVLEFENFGINHIEYGIELGNKSFGLLKYIDEIFGSVNDDSININNNSYLPVKYSKELDNDLIHATLLSERLFRTQLDLVMENINLKREVSVLEINSGQQVFYQNIERIITRSTVGFSMSDLNYTLAHSNKNLLSETLLNSKKLRLIDFDLNKTQFPYRKLSTQNLIVFRDPKISISQMEVKLDYYSLLRSIYTILCEGGFFLAFLRENVLLCEEIVCLMSSGVCKLEVDNFVRFAEKIGFKYICKKSDTFTCSSILFRKVDNIYNNDMLICITNNDLIWLETLIKAMMNEKIQRIWLTSNEEFSGIIGLIKSLRKELNGNKIRCVYYNDKQITFERALSLSKQTDLVQNVFQNNMWGSFRHISLPEAPPMPLTKFGQLKQTKSGDLSSFKWHNSSNILWPFIQNSQKEIFIHVYCSPINFKDVMHATGKLSPFGLSSHMSWDDIVLGFEFVGRRGDTGERVMGISRNKALSTCIIANQDFLWPIPKNWSMVEAATVPCVYATVYYALLIKGKMKTGESVLIHAGTGGVGQAAINICLSMSCKVYTTVGTDEKREILKKIFPQLNDDCISSSRDTSFEAKFMKQTEGRGVDLILNSLTDDMFWASLRCMASNGRFCEIGKYQFVNNRDLDSTLLLRNKTFHGIDLHELIPKHTNVKTSKKIEFERQYIWNLVRNGIKSGVVKPLPSTVFTINDIESAFRFMASGKHIGKIVIEMRSEEAVESIIPQHLAVNAIHQTHFHPKMSYIITGGLGGMGLELMYWMYERGARNFLLTTRTGVRTSMQKFMIRRMKKLNCNVIVSTDDASVVFGAKCIISKAQELGKIGGIFLLTLKLEDDIIENQTIEKFERVMKAKSKQALILDELSRELLERLDYFVGFSSASCGRGIAGQTNYAFANSILESVCNKRRNDGLHGIAIQWGVVGDVGFIADKYATNHNSNKTISGFTSQCILSCWAQLDRFIQSEDSVCASMVNGQDFKKEYDSKDSILETICNILGIKDTSVLDSRSTLGDSGLDSLMSAEIQTLFERELHLSLTSQEIRSVTIEQLKNGFN